MKTQTAAHSSGGTATVAADDRPPYLDTAQDALAFALSTADLDPSQTQKIELTSTNHRIRDWALRNSEVHAEHVDRIVPKLQRWLEARGWALDRTSETRASGYGDHFKVRYTAKYAHVRRIPGTKDAFEAARSTAEADNSSKRAALVSQVMDAIEPALPTGADMAVIDLSSRVGLHYDQAEKIKGDLRQTLSAKGWGDVRFRLERKSGTCDVGPACWIVMNLVVGKDPRPVRGAYTSVLFGFQHARARLQQLVSGR